MVKEIKQDGKIFYVCVVCNLKYGEKDWAEKCEKFCTEYNACSLEITKHAVKKT